jgi:hypothetical protein
MRRFSDLFSRVKDLRGYYDKFSPTMDGYNVAFSVSPRLFHVIESKIRTPHAQIRFTRKALVNAIFCVLSELEFRYFKC